MISTGISGTARPAHDAEERQQDAGEDVAVDGAAARQHRLAGAGHVRRVDAVADHLQREIGFHAGAHVEGAVMKQRPAAMRALDAAQIDARSCASSAASTGSPQIVPQQHVFGRDGGSRPRARTPNGRRRAAGRAWRGSRLRSPVRALARPRHRAAYRQRRGSSMRRPARSARQGRPRGCRSGSRLRCVAGRPVAVQSPARKRLRHSVSAAGRNAFCSGVAANVARRSRTICQGGSVSGSPATAATSLQIVCASSSRGI